MKVRVRTVWIVVLAAALLGSCGPPDEAVGAWLWVDPLGSPEGAPDLVLTIRDDGTATVTYCNEITFDQPRLGSTFQEIDSTERSCGVDINQRERSFVALLESTNRMRLWVSGDGLLVMGNQVALDFVPYTGA